MAALWGSRLRRDAGLPEPRSVRGPYRLAPSPPASLFSGFYTVASRSLSFTPGTGAPTSWTRMWAALCWREVRVLFRLSTTVPGTRCPVRRRWCKSLSPGAGGVRRGLDGGWRRSVGLQPVRKSLPEGERKLSSWEIRALNAERGPWRAEGF